MKRVVVLGGGVAGVAAAWAAREAGAEVTLLAGRPGASTMTSGAVDDEPWDVAGASRCGPLGALSRAFVDALGLWSVGDGSARVATPAGVLRRARGVDRSLLDLAALHDLVVGIPRVARASWDADGLARALSESSSATSRKLRFEAVDLPFLRFDDERVIPDVDLAARHDDDDRVEWLVERARETRRSAGVSALLVGPWLGASSPAAPRLTAAVGIPIGELTSRPGEAAGARLETALQRLLSDAGARVVSSLGRVLGHDGSYRVEHDGAVVPADVVVLAVGGVLAGGVVLARTNPEIIGGPPPAFHAPSWPEAALGWESDDSGLPPTRAVPDLRWQGDDSVLERVGIVHRDGCAVDHGRQQRGALFVAGDVCSRAPRTILAAVDSGVSAGSRAAR